MQIDFGLAILYFARGQGIEPQLTASKAAVRPLDDPRINFFKFQILNSILYFLNSD